MRIRLVSSLVCASMLIATPAWADGWRYPWEIPGMGNIAIRPASVGGRIANNERFTIGADFASGRMVTVGGGKTSYMGNNVPLVGDFNGDGHDDLLVRWLGSGHQGVWTMSLSDGKGKFRAGQGVTFGGTKKAYVGDNIAFVGDFNGDGRDDVGVHWMSGPHRGKWTVSLNDGKNNFHGGKGIAFAGATKAYVGHNEPIVGDFDGDGYDDIGVRWKGGSHKGQWWFSRNDRKGGFHGGRQARFGGTAVAYKGTNQALVADFDGDGRDDIAVKWTAGTHTGKWTISLNDGTTGGKWRFAPGRSVTFGHGQNRAYVGKNMAIAGDFGGDGFADVGVHWTGGHATGQWVTSRNVRRAEITQTQRVQVRIPIIFVNFAGGTKTTDAQARSLIAETRRYFQRTSHKHLDVRFRHEIVNLPHGAQWVDGHPQPQYHSTTGALLNGGEYDSVEEYDGYGCRFDHPTKPSKQIIFKNAKGNLGWANNANIHRNYCQVAERNYARDALEILKSTDPKGFDSLMKWSRAGSKGPTIMFSSPDLTGGGNRTFNKSWGGAAWPLSVDGISFFDYMFMKQSPRIFAHEVGHFIGHGQELYDGSGCTANRDVGFLGPYDVMGNQGTYFAAMSAVSRWRFGFSPARYLTPADGTVKVSLPLAMAGSTDRSLAVIQPDPKGHPDEVFVVENRGEVVAYGHPYDKVPAGLYIYHVNSKAPSKGQPLIELVAKQGSCSSSMKPHQGTFSPSSVPAAKFHDGKSAKFSIKNITRKGDALRLTVSFGS